MILFFRSLLSTLPSLRRADGKVDATAFFLSLLTIGIFTLSIVQVKRAVTPTFEFLDNFAPVLNEGGIVEPGEDLVIELRLASENEPGKTDIFGQFVCAGGYSALAEQYRPYSINVGGGDPFEVAVPWSVPTPKDLPRGATCSYRHAAVLANGTVEVVPANFVVAD